MSSLAEKLPAFKIHCFIKKEQSSAFQRMHTTPHQHHAVLQVDFSENASIIEQDEIQSGHWVHKQLAVFSAVGWTKEGTTSFAVVSDRLSHDKYTSAVMLETIIDQIKTEKTTNLTHIDIFSDGAAQHFKQKFMLTLISCMKQTKGLGSQLAFLRYVAWKGSCRRGWRHCQKACASRHHEQEIPC